MRFANFSIRNKIVTIVLLITVVALGAGFAIQLFNDSRIYRTNLITSTVLLARVTGDSCVSDIAFGDREESMQTLKRLAAAAKIEAAALYDAEGKLFASYAVAGAATPPLSSNSSRLLHDDLLTVTEPVVYENERYGTIVLTTSTRPIKEAIANHTLRTLLLLVVLLLAAFVIALKLERLISRPILDLTATARVVSEQHDYTVRASKSSRDEIGVLCDGFNEMLAEIERRQRERDEADRRTREKSQFLANTSHELRTPLNAIIGFSEVLLGRLQSKVTDRERRFLENIHTSGQHLLGIVNDILDLSKVEAGLMELRTEVFYVEPAIEGVCSLMKGVSSRRGVLLDVDVDPDLPPIEADPVKVKQVLYNLISNAIKFSPAQSTVAVRAKVISADKSALGEETIRIEVEDHGIGIDPQYHERVFEEFRQLDPPQGTKSAEGTGLGLALVRKLVRLHRGEITLESEPGKGSLFTVDLPRRFGTVAEAQAVRSMTVAQPRPVVLVVEDELEPYRLIERELVEGGYMPMRAHSGEEALTMARALVPAAITLDLILPGMDGWDVLRLLKAEPATRKIPVIIVSSVDSKELGVAFGADDYLIKPLAPAQLVESLERNQRLSPEGARAILIVSDDPVLHESLRVELRPQGYQLMHAYSIAGALAEVREHRPTLAFVDLSVDDMRGAELALRLRTDDEHSMSVIVVGSSELSAGERAGLTERFTALLDRHDAGGFQVARTVHDLLERKRAEPPVKGTS